MTTRTLVSLEGMALRSARRLPALPLLLAPSLPASTDTPAPPSAPQPHKLPPQTEPEEHTPKIERETSAPPVISAGEGVENERRVTRSRANSIARVSTCAAEPPARPTVEAPSSDRKEETSESKKERLTTSPVNPPSADPTPSDPLPPPLPPARKKTSSRPPPVSDSPPGFSPYGFRKSYRKCPRGQIMAFPYRKWHDPLEGRITGVLNKLAGERECRKEVEGLADRLPKASCKDLRNRFVVAGLRMVVRLAKDLQRQGSSGVEGRLLSRLQAEERALQARIAEELSDFSQYEEPAESQPLSDPEASSYRALVMKKLYSVLKRGKLECKSSLRERVVRECEGFFAGEVSMEEMVRFVRKRLQG